MCFPPVQAIVAVMSAREIGAPAANTPVKLARVEREGHFHDHSPFVNLNGRNAKGQQAASAQLVLMLTKDTPPSEETA